MLQLPPLAGETVGLASVVRHRIEHEVNLALPTYAHVQLPTSTCVTDMLQLDAFNISDSKHRRWTWLEKRSWPL